MRIGSQDLLEKYGSPIKVARALLLNKLKSNEQEFVSDIVDKVVLKAAKWQIKQKRKKAKA